jgi:hypothetical protein
MVDLTRKHHMVGAEQNRDPAQKHGASESQAVPEVVDVALATEEVMAAIRELQRRDALHDVFGVSPVRSGVAPDPGLTGSDVRGRPG